MHRLFLIALLAAATACSHKSSPTTPSNQPPAVVDAPITGDSMIAFAQQRFPAAVAAETLKLEFGSASTENEIAEELSIMGITTTAQLAAIVPPDYQTKGFDAMAAAGASTTNLAALMRDLMIIHDVRGYFTNAWRNKWSASRDDFPAPAAYGVDLGVMEELGVFEDGGGDYDPCMEGDPCGDPCGD
jgi:hypothetical protein